MIRAVLDPGVLIAGLITPTGIPSDIIRAWRRGVFDLVVSPLLLDELTDTLLRDKFRRWVTEVEAVAFIEVLRLSAFPGDDPVLAEPISRDPNDDYLIALAREVRANVLVSGDSDLTSLAENQPPIVTPRAFWSAIASP